jgi:hypothetical protein
MSLESKLKIQLNNGIIPIFVQYVNNHLILKEMLINIIGIYISYYIVVFVEYRFVVNVQERKSITSVPVIYVF